MGKKLKIVVVSVVILLFMIVIFPLYIMYGSGDIGGRDVLQYPFLEFKPLCFLAGGQFKTEVSGWGGKDMRFCLVKNAVICRLRGGRILTAEEQKSGLVGIEPIGSCVKK